MLLHVRRTEPLEKARHLARAPSGGLPGYGGGQFIPAAVLRAEQAKAETAFPELIRSTGERLQFLRQVWQQNVALMQEGTTTVALVPLSTIEARLKTVIRESYAHALRLGRRAGGNLMSPSDADLKDLEKLRLDEYGYLKRFLGDMSVGAGRMSYEQRMTLYANALREVFWIGWVSGKPADTLLWFRLGETGEHCGTCQDLARRSPFTAQEFRRVLLPAGQTPQGAGLECGGWQCQCWITEQANGARPAWM